MKNLGLIILCGMLFVNFAVHAQDCTYYFPTKVGASLEMKTYSAKDKLTGSSKSKILENSGNSVKFESEVFDDKGKSLSKGTMEVKCENGEFVLDMKSYFSSVDLSKYKDMDVKIDAKNMTIPSKLQAGQKLNDGEITIKIATGGFTIMNMSTKVTNRNVVGFEDITTPAGTFKCAKITSDIDSKVMVKVKSKVTEWISEKVGTVRVESYDQKDKLVSYTVLAAYNQ